MDLLDKKIIRRLLGNSRESFHSIARAFDVTCPTITSRVNRLRQMGVIQRFVTELSHETMGVEWILTEIKTNGGIRKSDLLQEFQSNACIGDVYMLGRSRYLVLAEVYPEEKSGYVSCLKKIDDIEYIEVSDIHPISTQISNGNCKFTTRGQKIDLSPIEVDLLRFLVRNSRTPIKTITDCTGYSTKLVRRVMRKFIQCNGIHLTLKLNLSQCGQINFILRTRLRDMTVQADEIADWVSCRYPEELWFTLFAPRSDSLLHYMTVRQPQSIERVIREAIKHPRIEDVEATIIYSMFKSEGRTQQFLKHCIGNFSEDELELPLSSLHEPSLLEQEIHT